MTDKPAYPVPDGESWQMELRKPEYNGLTRRELFAAMAMQGMLSCASTVADDAMLAKYAVDAAEALIAELDKPR